MSKKIVQKLYKSSFRMGNTFGYHKNLNVFIETQKPYYNSGSSIEGTIFVDVKNNCLFDALYLRIEGNQQCKWFEGSSKNRRKYTGSQKFYIVQHILHKFENKILQQGKYAYPFSLELSDNIPGSFESPDREAKIEYGLIAYFVNYNENSTATYEKPVIIRQPFRQEVSKYNGHAQATSNAACGNVKISVDYDRNVVYQGQDIQIDVRINNLQGKKDVKKINAELVQYTFVASNGNASRTYRKVIISKTINEGVKRRENRQLEFPFKIPPVKYQTAISTLVANYYRLQVSADAGFGSQNLSIYAPIFILKLNFDIKGQMTNRMSDGYIQHKAICIRSGEHYFKKNRNLQIVNFKHEDFVTHSYYGSENLSPS